MFQKLFSQNVYVLLNKMDATLRIRKNINNHFVYLIAISRVGSV